MSLRRGYPTWKEEYNSGLEDAIKYFWRTRDEQSKKQLGRGVKDAGTRGAVTGGKQLNGLVEMMKEIAIDVGIPENYIYIKGNALPGYLRPTKDWDFIIVSPEKHLIACIEFKSQVGSFGNNFNNRVEEALGSSVDIHTAFRDKNLWHTRGPMDRLYDNSRTNQKVYQQSQDMRASFQGIQRIL
jgi:hypothetical protein